MIRALIVDDEAKSRKVLGNLLKQFCPEVAVLAMAETITDAITLAEKYQPDVVFLDVNLNAETGFDLLEKIANPTFSVIFTTAHEEHAFKAFRFSAVDYLLKPIHHEELIKAVEKIKIAKRNNTSGIAEELLKRLKETKNEKPQISISASDGLIFIKTSEIIWLEASGAYTKFHLLNKKEVLSSKNIKDYETKLTEDMFFRIHNSAIININEITKYVRGSGGYVVMSDGNMVNISRQRKEAFLSKIGNK